MRKETKKHIQRLEKTFPIRILRYLTLTILTMLLLMCVLIFFIAISPIFKEIIENVRDLSIYGWIGVIFIFGYIIFLFDLIVRNKAHFEEDINDVHFFLGEPREYLEQDGRLEIGRDIIFKPYNENIKPLIIPVENITGVDIYEKDLKDFSKAGQWAAVRSPILGSFTMQNYLIINYKTPDGEKTIQFRTHRKSRQHKVLRNKIERLMTKA